MRERQIHRLFVGSVALKGILALLETLAGLVLAMTSRQALVNPLTVWSYGELAANRHDRVASQLLEFARGFSIADHNFYAFYLISHGVVKGVLVLGLLREKRWAYPASFVVFGLFIAYQLYRFTFTHQAALIVLSLLDLIVIALAAHEYRLVRRARGGFAAKKKRG